MLIRVLLIAVLVYLGLRALLAILFPPSPREAVKGGPQQTRSRIDAERIQDASFKDIPDDHET